MKKILFLFLLLFIFSCKDANLSALNPNGDSNNTNNNSDSTKLSSASNNTVLPPANNTLAPPHNNITVVTPPKPVVVTPPPTTSSTPDNNSSNIKSKDDIVPGTYRGSLTLTLFKGTTKIDIPEPLDTYIVLDSNGYIYSEMFDREKFFATKRPKNGGGYEYYAEYNNAYKGISHKVEMKKVSDSTISVVIVSEKPESGVKYIYAYSGNLSR